MRRLAEALAIGVLVAVCASSPKPVSAEERPVQSPPAATAATAPAVLEVSCEKNLLTVRAEGADLTALLKQVAEASGIPIEVGEGVSGIVTVTFAGLALEEGINRILEAAGARNFAAELVKEGEQERPVLTKNAAVHRAGAEPASGTSPKKEFRTPESVRAWLKGEVREGVVGGLAQGTGQGARSLYRREDPRHVAARHSRGVSRHH